MSSLLSAQETTSVVRAQLSLSLAKRIVFSRIATRRRKISGASRAVAGRVDVAIRWTAKIVTLLCLWAPVRIEFADAVEVCLCRVRWRIDRHDIVRVGGGESHSPGIGECARDVVHDGIHVVDS